MIEEIRMLEFRATREVFQAHEIHLRARIGRAFIEPVTLTEKEPGVLVQPFLTLEPREAQQLMDELWLCGLRPTEGTGSAGSLAATERHLADMRAIAFSKLRIKNSSET